MFDFDSDNTGPKVTNKSVDDSKELSLFDLVSSDNELKSNTNSVEHTLHNNEEVIINNENEEMHAGNEVEVEYDGQHYIGVAHSIYNDGNTVNVIFDHMNSAFHISKVKKL